MNVYLRLAFAVTLLVAGLGASASAGLPPVPGAHMDSGTKASRQGDSGGALEPYLITLLLPFGGIVMAVAGFAMDRRLRATGGG